MSATARARLRVVWDDFAGGGEKKSDRHVIGTTVLIILLGFALFANLRGARHGANGRPSD